MATTPTILIEQVTLGAGTAGVSRADGVVSQVVTLTDPANPGVQAGRLWEVFDTDGAVVTLSDNTAEAPTFTPGASDFGTHTVFVSYGDGTKSWVPGANGERIQIAQGGFGIAQPVLGNIMPGAGETTQFGAAGFAAKANAILRPLDAQLPTTDEKGALSGTGTPSAGNVFVTNDDSRLSDSRAPSGTAGGDLGGTYPNPTVDDGADGTAIHNNTAGEINAITAKSPTVGADILLLEDSESFNAKKKITVADLRITESQVTDLIHTAAGGPGTDTTAIHDDTSGEINAVALKATPVAADVILLEDSADSFNKKKTTLTDLLGGSSPSPSLQSNLWYPPAVAHALDQEFDDVTLDPGWSWSTAPDAAIIDPYAIHSSGGPRIGVHTDLRRSWLMAQPPGNNVAQYWSKAHTIPTNFLMWARMSFNSRSDNAPANNDMGLGIIISATSGGAPDADNSLRMFLNETDSGTIQANALSTEATSTLLNEFTTDLYITTGQGQPLEYVAIHKVGATYHFWVGTANGSWIHLGSRAYAGAAVDRIGLIFHNNATTSPGTAILGADFVRFVESATFLP